MMPETLGDAIVRALALAIVHFVWQGFALWGLALCLLHVARPTTPQIRYAALCGLLVLLAGCPFATFGVAFQQPASHRASEPAYTAPAIVAESPTRQAPAALGRTSWTSAAYEAIGGAQRVQNTLVAIWLAGSVAMASRLGLATLGVASLRRRGRPLDDRFDLIVDSLVERLAFRRRPRVQAVAGLPQAVALGLFKPLVLLPGSWLCELPPQVLENVIAHELAHLRRWDLAINFVQRVIECALFFHPAVWWCSKRIRAEREVCCDALAVRASGNRVAYARALTFLASRRMADVQPSLAAGIGGPQMTLLTRVREVLGVASPGRSRFYGTTCAAAGAAAASIVWLAGVSVFYASSRATEINPVPSSPAHAAFPYAKAPEGLHAVEPQTAQFMFGANTETAAAAPLPSERNKTRLPAYTIEPPDILFIEAARIVPKGESGPQQPITGEHLVAPDGQVNLGSYGQVYVAGMTVEEAEAAIDNHLAKFLRNPDVFVSVFAYNSKVYYVVLESSEKGDTVARFPITGNETVLDALSLVGGLSNLGSKKIWIARPSPGASGTDTILAIDWDQIASGSSTGTNYQVLPGDRIFVKDKAPPAKPADPSANDFPSKQPAQGYDFFVGRMEHRADDGTVDWNANYQFQPSEQMFDAEPTWWQQLLEKAAALHGGQEKGQHPLPTKSAPHE